MVSRSGRPRPAARSGHTRADHGGEQETLTHCTPPGGDYSHIHAVLPNQKLRTYIGGGRVGGKETTGAPVGRPLLDARQSPLGVAAGEQIGRSGNGGGDGGSRRDIGARRAGMSDHRRGDDRWEGGKVDDQVGEGGGSSPISVPRWGHPRGGSLAVSGNDPERGRGLTWHMPCGGDLEGSDGDSQSPLHCLHHLPRLPPRIPGRSQYGDRHP